MRIVMFTDAYWPRVNGVTVSVDSFSRALIKQGHEVLIVCSFYPDSYDSMATFAEPEKNEIDPQILRVPSMPAFITKEDRIAKVHKWFWVFKQVELFAPEIIHINTEMVIAEFGFFYALTHNLPAIYTFHTMWEDYGPNYFPMLPSFAVKFIIRGVLKNILNRSYKVIVPTPQIDAVVQKYSPGTETFLLPTGIDPALFNRKKEEVKAFRLKFEERYPNLRGKRILLFAGRVAREKNIGFLLKILPGILEKHPDTILLIAGNGPDQDYFKKEAALLSIENSCVFTGYIERRELAMVYAMSYIFVFPSLTDTQGLVTLEAMFSGIPVVAIGVLGTLMVMGGDNGGFMVKNDPAEFSARVLELLENTGLYREKGADAKRHASSWSIEEITRKLAGIYKSTAASYREEYGESRAPVWELITDKRWWKVNNKILRSRTRKKWREIKAKIGKP